MLARHLSGIDLTEYADGGMEGARLAWAQQHLRRCQACAEALAGTQETVGALQAMAVPAPPRDLRWRVAARLSAAPLPSIPCREAGELIHASLDGALSPLPAGLLRLHLGACGRCRGELASLRAATALVRSLPPVAAPARIWEAVHAASRTRPAPWGVRLRPAMAAAAMAAGALLTLHYAPRAVPPQTALVNPAPAPERIARAVEPAAPRPQPSPVVKPETITPAASRPTADLPRAPIVVAAAPRSVARQPGQIVFARARKAPLSAEPVLTLSRERTAGGGVPGVAASVAIGGHVPSALQVLRTVARAVSSDQIAQLPMARAGERYDILVSEEKLTQLPKAATPSRSPEKGTEAAPSRSAPGRDTGASEGQGRPAPGRAATLQDPTATA
jgi:anti-sigma factor RsiW